MMMRGRILCLSHLPKLIETVRCAVERLGGFLDRLGCLICRLSRLLRGH